MHVPDHFLDPATSVATAVVAGGALTVVAARLRARPPVSPSLFAATTAAIFGLQMLNYPVADGTSGHLIGGALAAAVLGPLWGMLSVAVVLMVQCLVFADGGLTALGTNVLLLAVVGVLVGWVAIRGVLALVGRTGALAAGMAAGVGGLSSVVAAAVTFTGLFAVGGTVELPLSVLASQMVGVHLLIGVGEALIAGAVVAGLMLVSRKETAISAGSPIVEVTGPVSLGLGVVGVLASGLLAPIASTYPDGLEATAATLGFADAARAHFFEGMPLADYGAASGMAIGLAGIIGVAICGVVAVLAARLLLVRVTTA